MDEFLNPEGENELEPQDEYEQIVENILEAMRENDESDEEDDDEEPPTPPISLADKLKALSIVPSLVADAASTSGRDIRRC